MNQKKYYSTEERIAYYRKRIESLEAKRASEVHEGTRTEERLLDLLIRIEECYRKLAELVNTLDRK